MDVGKEDLSYLGLNKELKKSKREMASNLHRIKEDSKTNPLLVTVISEYNDYLSNVINTKSELEGVFKKIEKHLIDLMLDKSVSANLVNSELVEIKKKLGKIEFDKIRLNYKLSDT